METKNKLDDSELIKMVDEFKVFKIMKLDLMIESQTRIYLLARCRKYHLLEHYYLIQKY